MAPTKVLMKNSSVPEVRVMDLAALAPAPYNPRTISKEAALGLRASLRRFGLVQPVIWNRRTKRVVGGHQRIDALKALGKTEAQVVVVDLPESEEKALNVTLNNPAIGGDFTDGLQAILAELSAASPIEFEELRLDELLAAGLVGVVEDEIPDVPKKAITKPGDLWILGPHRLTCGDATNAADVATALGATSPSLMVTDPPYGVGYDPSWRATAGINRSKKKLGRVTNDDRADWTEAWQLFPGDVAYVWHAGLRAGEVAVSLSMAGFELRSQIIWAKDRFALSRGDYHWQHEPAWYAVRKGSSANRTDDRSQSTLWQVAARDDDGHGHGTQKPVEVMARPIRNHEGDVYEPFAGSGTTLIAAEQLGRRCSAIEIEPTYCDVVVMRWERLTGGKAKRGQGSRDAGVNTAVLSRSRLHVRRAQR
jgi:DNA modification methylase